MVRLQWDKPQERFSEHGLDRGVLYVDGVSYTWNGLRAVNITPLTDIKQHYLDGLIRLNTVQTTGYKVSLTALTYPDVFDEVLGNASFNGLNLPQGRPKKFSMSWRTTKRNDFGQDYKIHFVTNAIATPSTDNYQSDTNIPTLTDFSWELLLAQPTNTLTPASYYTLDLKSVPEEYIKDFDIYLYGDTTYTPVEPSYDTIKSILENRLGFTVPPPESGFSKVSVGGSDLTGSLANGFYKLTSNTTLIANTSGFYTKR